MINLKFSEVAKSPQDILLCGIPVRVCLSSHNPCNVEVRLSCIHKFEESDCADVEILTGKTYVFAYNGKEEELRVGRQFTILDAH